ncbi:MAG: hypothetical protein COY40_04500 [Alphaproteobacteria bacterium CG_4_10_14_0_8_um_filter_53_9]|nr:MAG: hypothetical protein COY40_04500 [Alphaproteobacteria bacterium CG_4_10_14_0_8_um_filter_53_9]
MYIFAALATFTFSIAALIIMACVAWYFLPTLIASFRNHPQTGAIGVLNLFLGWTMLGWLAALVWAFINVPSGPATPPPASAPRSPKNRPMKSVN